MTVLATHTRTPSGTGALWNWLVNTPFGLRLVAGISILVSWHLVVENFAPGSSKIVKYLKRGEEAFPRFKIG